MARLIFQEHPTNVMMLEFSGIDYEGDAATVAYATNAPHICIIMFSITTLTSVLKKIKQI